MYGETHFDYKTTILYVCDAVDVLEELKSKHENSHLIKNINRFKVFNQEYFLLSVC